MGVSSYSEAIDYLQEYLPSFNPLDKKTITSLSKIRALCAWTHHPQQDLRIIHVAGTNGKGSVSHLIASILIEAGYRTGLHTSPHLIDFCERTQINGIYMEKSFVVEMTNRLIQSQLVKTIQPSFFDVSIWLAFEYFKQKQTDYVLLEVGLGGRKDTTNIVHPILSIITSIGFDHQALLGDTLPEIASEKAGIIKRNVPVVVGERHDELVAEVFQKKAQAMNAPLTWATEMWQVIEQHETLEHLQMKLKKKDTSTLDIACGLLGNYQVENTKTVLSAVDALNTVLPQPIDTPTLQRGFARVKKNNVLRARWDILRRQPLVIVDGAHNPAAFACVIEQVARLKEKTGKPGLVIFSMLQDKNVGECLALFEGKGFEFIYCQIDYKRAMPVDELNALARQYGLAGKTFPSTSKAMEYSLQHYPHHLILIVGSLYLAGEALSFFDNEERL